MNRTNAWHVLLLSALVAVAANCGEDDDRDNPSTSSTSSSTGSGASTGSGGSGAATGSGGEPVGGAGGEAGSGGTGATACTATAPGPTRGSPIAISPDDSTLLITNRDSGSVTMMNVTYPDEIPSLLFVAELKDFAGQEPWQVAIDGCGSHAYVALRASKQVVELYDVALDPKVGASVDVGSEPTAVALSPNNTKLYVANWVDGTVSVIAPATMAATKTIDLNPALVGTGNLGTVTSRPGLAHPRSIAITNDGDADDTDEKIYVTEYFAHRTAPESADGKNSDVNKQGYVYRISAADDSVVAIPLGPITDTGFQDSSGAVTGCFPNQLQSVTVTGNFAYVTSVCASPVGPVGIFQKGACTGNAQCTAPGSVCSATGSCTLSCVADADCGFGSPAGTCDADTSCRPIPTNVKTTTHPAVHVIDTTTDAEVTAARTNLNKVFQDLYVENAVADTPVRRMPLVSNDIGFVPETGEAYITANGTDAIFRVVYDGATSALTAKGGGAVGKEFISLFITDAAKRGQNPVGIAVANTRKFGFVTNDITRNVAAIDLTTQIVVGSDGADAQVETSSGPPLTPEDISRQAGKRFFNTGLGRWSLRGQGWGACQSCHIDGLTDNVTWYFARGPRQSVSLDGSFSSTTDDQRIFNWTAFLDEIDDFEGNTRGVSGGVGALVTADNNPPTNMDRINLNDVTAFPPAGAAGLNGSTTEITTNVSVLKDWAAVTDWIKSLRSPKGVTELDATKVAAGQALFTDATTGGGCNGCHAGSMWTIGTRFWTPSGTTNEALLAASWDATVAATSFPVDLLPATDVAQRNMRAPSPKNGNLDQILCALRPVGTFGVSDAAVSVRELRANMVTPGQGNEPNGKGYNPPGLLGMAVSAPYFHAGNARTLEELLGSLFAEHTTAINASFAPSATDIENLVAFLLSIDEATTPPAVPALGSAGGSFCAAP